MRIFGFFETLILHSTGGLALAVQSACAAVALASVSVAASTKERVDMRRSNPRACRASRCDPLSGLPARDVVIDALGRRRSVRRHELLLPERCAIHPRVKPPVDPPTGGIASLTVGFYGSPCG